MSKALITILGCGNSTGVPSIGNYWGACDANEPKNKRTRCSIAVQTDSTTLIIDTGPDFREQINRADIRQIDGVLYTHMHSDHVNGIDELRIIKFRNEKRVPVYMNTATLEDLQGRFEYMFSGGKNELYPPILDPFELRAEHMGLSLDFGDISFVPFVQDHGTVESIGYRFGDCAYCVDVLDLDAAAIDALKGVKTWIVDCAAYKKDDNLVHAGLNKIFALNKDIGAARVILTSLSLSMDYQTLMNELPNGYEAAFDRMSIEVAV